MKAFKSPSDLLLSVTSGDEKAMQELFRLYQSKLYTYIYHITKSKEISEELVMDIFTKIWMARELLDDVQNLDGFLYRIAKNKAIDFLRAAAKEKRLQALLLAQMENSKAAHPDEKVILKEYELHLKQLLQNLTNQQQLVFNLSREQGLSHQQIASKLNLSKNTVKNHIVAALKHLRHHLLLILMIKIFLFF